MGARLQSDMSADSEKLAPTRENLWSDHRYFPNGPTCRTEIASPLGRHFYVPICFRFIGTDKSQRVNRPLASTGTCYSPFGRARIGARAKGKNGDLTLLMFLNSTQFLQAYVEKETTCYAGCINSVGSQSRRFSTLELFLRLNWLVSLTSSSLLLLS